MKTNAATLQRDLAGKVQQRALATVTVDAINVDARTVDISWASETPVPRWYGTEILDCAPPSIRLGRLMDGAALLFNHDPDELIGVVESVQVDVDKVCRARVRFDTGDDGEERFLQVQNRVLRFVSVGYFVHRMVLQEESDSGDTYRITDWEPFEISMVSIPADTMAGVGRSIDPPQPDPQQTPPVIHPVTAPLQLKETRTMDQPIPTTIPDNSAAIAAADIARRDAIVDLGVKYAAYITPADVQTACRSAHSLQTVNELVMERMATKHTDTRGAHIGMADGEVRQYSVARAIKAALTGDWAGAGLEREATEAVAKRFGMASKGILLPMDVIAHRDFTVGTAAEAGNLVQTSLRGDLFADVLRNRLALGRLGTTMLFGLTGNVDLPRKASGSALAFVTEIAAIAETQPNTGKVSLTPKRIGAYIEFSKQAVIQSALAVEPMLRQDIFSEYQVQFENAAINGSGAGGNPRGIRNTSGIGAVIGGANGATINWGHVVGLESACANANSEPDKFSGYLLNTKARGWMKQTLKAAALPFIWDNGGQPLNGYRGEVTNNVPSNLTKGTASGIASSLIYSSNWDMLAMATFGAVEILVDETTIGINGMNRLIMNAFVDVGVRRTADFATMEDALTA